MQATKIEKETLIADWSYYYNIKSIEITIV